MAVGNFRKFWFCHRCRLLKNNSERNPQTFSFRHYRRPPFPFTKISRRFSYPIGYFKRRRRKRRLSLSNRWKNGSRPGFFKKENFHKRKILSQSRRSFSYSWRRNACKLFAGFYFRKNISPSPKSRRRHFYKKNKNRRRFYWIISP